MREVTTLADLPEALAAARREASAAFGDDTLILERLIVGARHVEVQVLGDSFGEPDPPGRARLLGPATPPEGHRGEPGARRSRPELRAALGEAALRVSRRGRLHQRRHLRISAGRRRPVLVHRDERPPPGRAPGDRAGDRLRPGAGPDRDRGRPPAALAPGGRPAPRARRRVPPLRRRSSAPGPAVARGGSRGSARRSVRACATTLGTPTATYVPPFYDTMFGKLIAYGEDRASAIRRARAALDGYVVEGIPTNRPLLAWILDHPTFRDGQATTGFLGAARPESDAEPAIPPEALAAAVAYDLAAPDRVRRTGRLRPSSGTGGSPGRASSRSGRPAPTPSR